MTSYFSDMEKLFLFRIFGSLTSRSFLYSFLPYGIYPFIQIQEAYQRIWAVP